MLQHKLDALGERKVIVGQELATVEERLRSGEAGQRSLAEVDEAIGGRLRRLLPLWVSINWRSEGNISDT